MLAAALGAEPRIPHDGPSGFALIAARRPDVAQLDIGMPGTSGHDLARMIRAEPWGRDVMLVALTGWGQDEDRRRSLAAGFDLHLVKPVALARVREVLQDAASHRSLRDRTVSRPGKDATPDEAAGGPADAGRRRA
jgi:CheY-like chemotaxis protein